MRVRGRPLTGQIRVGSAPANRTPNYALPGRLRRAVPSRAITVLAASTTRVLLVPGKAGRERPGRLAGHRLKAASRRGHGGDQLVQRPGQVVSGDQGTPLTGAKMVNPTPGTPAVGRAGSQGRRPGCLPPA